MRSLLVAGLLALGAAGCRTSAPATLTLPSGQVLRGSATTSVNGQFTVGDARVNCYGSYEGRTLGGVGLTFRRKAPVTLTCSDGRNGTSPDPLFESGIATVTFTDGKRGQLRLDP